MKGFVGTVVSGAIGLAALYMVGKIAFRVGHDLAEAELRYEQLQQDSHAKEAKADRTDQEESGIALIPMKKQSKLGMLFGLQKAFRNGGNSVVGNLLKNPENHVIEACVKGREIHVNVKPKTA